MAKKDKRDPNRKLSIDDAIDEIKKIFGEDSISKGKRIIVCDAVPTGSTSLDIALGIGGYPRGRIVEIFGPEASGKTTLALHAIANIQKLGGTAAFIDAEHAVDADYAERIGVNWNDLIFSQPSSGDEGLFAVETLVSAEIDMVVVDSVAALTPLEEIQKGPGEHTMGAQARLMSQALRKIVPKNKHSSLIFINQLREKIGVVFGNPEVTPGGRALKFYSSVRLEVRRLAAIKNNDEVIGNRVRVKTIKNKVAPPFCTAEFDIIFGKGIDAIGDIFDVAVSRDIIPKSGNFYTISGTKLNGRQAALKFLNENDEATKDLEKQLKGKENDEESGQDPSTSTEICDK